MPDTDPLSAPVSAGPPVPAGQHTPHPYCVEHDQPLDWCRPPHPDVMLPVPAGLAEDIAALPLRTRWRYTLRPAWLRAVIVRAWPGRWTELEISQIRRRARLRPVYTQAECDEIAAQAAAGEREAIREHILNRSRQLEPIADKATITELQILAEELGWTGRDGGHPAVVHRKIRTLDGRQVEQEIEVNPLGDPS